LSVERFFQFPDPTCAFAEIESCKRLLAFLPIPNTQYRIPVRAFAEIESRKRLLAFTLDVVHLVEQIEGHHVLLEEGGAEARDAAAVRRFARQASSMNFE
jgi:hypothetical protein